MQPSRTRASSKAEKKEPDLAQILREMEDELARDVDKVTAERSTFEQAEKGSKRRSWQQSCLQTQWRRLRQLPWRCAR